MLETKLGHHPVLRQLDMLAPVLHPRHDNAFETGRSQARLRTLALAV